MNDGFTKLINDAQKLIPRLPEVILSLAVGYLVVVVLTWVAKRALKLLRLPRALVSILASLISTVFWVMLASYLLSMLGLSQVAAILSGSLLVFGLAIANGANTLVGDVISGIFLAKDPDFNVGYRVKMGEVVGIIESIDIRKTRIRTDAGTLVILPNASLDKDHWEVLSDEKPKKS